MINWQAIDTVLLDMDGTLLDLHFDNYFWLSYVPEQYGLKHGMSTTDAMSHLFQLFEQARGSIAWYCLDYWSNELSLDIAGLKQKIKEKIAIRPFAEEFLSQLKSSDKNVILLTNAHQKSLNLKMQETGIAHYFDAVVSSHKYGLPKEEQGLWRAFQKDFPFTPSSTLLIDDTETVLNSASMYGIEYLMTMKQPDSHAEPRSNLNYPTILHFDEIMLNG